MHLCYISDGVCNGVTLDNRDQHVYQYLMAVPGVVFEESMAECPVKYHVQSDGTYAISVSMANFTFK